MLYVMALVAGTYMIRSIEFVHFDWCVSAPTLIPISRKNDQNKTLQHFFFCRANGKRKHFFIENAGASHLVGGARRDSFSRKISSTLCRYSGLREDCLTNLKKLPDILVFCDFSDVGSGVTVWWTTFGSTSSVMLSVLKTRIEQSPKAC